MPATLHVTVMRVERRPDDRRQLTVCRRPGTSWMSGEARSATHDEVKRITAPALALFDARETFARKRA